jgi:hypothetical protein
MSLLVAVLTVVLLAVVIAVISAPLRATRASHDPEHPERADLQAARESKYREIRDTELDYRTGKLSHEDFQTINHALRGEAMEILDALQPLEGPPASRTDSLERDAHEALNDGEPLGERDNDR